jgi:hypothetical protein
LITMKIGKAATVFESGSDALKQRGQLLTGGSEEKL